MGAVCFAFRTKGVLLPRTQLLLYRPCSPARQQKVRLARRTQRLPRVLHGPSLHGDPGRKQPDLQAYSAKYDNYLLLLHFIHTSVAWFSEENWTTYLFLWSWFLTCLQINRWDIPTFLVNIFLENLKYCKHFNLLFLQTMYHTSGLRAVSVTSRAVNRGRTSSPRTF